MERINSDKLQSSWMDTHFNPMKSAWLSENLQYMNRNFKEIMKLIDEGSGSAIGAEIYDPKRPQLIALVEEFYKMYHALAEHCDQLELERHNPEPLRSGLGQGSPQLTPGTGASFSSVDGSIDISKEHYESSSFSSDSESESINRSESTYNSKVTQMNGIGQQQENSELSTDIIRKKKEHASYKELVARNIRYEEELRLLNQKLQQSENEIARLNIVLEKGQTGAGDLQVELQAARDEIRARDATIEESYARASQLENQIAELQNHISDSSQKAEMLMQELEVAQEKMQKSNEDTALLTAKFDSERGQVLELQELVSGYKSDVSDRDLVIMDLRAALSESQQKLFTEKEQLLLQMTSCKERQQAVEAGLKEWECRGKLLELNLRLRENEMKAMKEWHDTEKKDMQVDIYRLKESLASKDNRVEELNKDLDKLKLKYDMLVAEKDGLDAQIQNLLAEASAKNDQMQQMENHVCNLQKEHQELIACSAQAQKLAGELRSRVEQLENEVDGQKVVISDGAEKKREAIRQLCFSLEHYRSGYQELRQAFLGHKRHAVRAS
ncbi:hypothetical protein BT93_E0947 [Corymbia citriodora subsp. variegata]|nr:hypothetical protein BT93_E0947 [Corymbia citriodora subsp. variegata]KAF8028193.1 hypothetical protein BT93_E0947 [Corymbia citriodora subsp. variegata]KAF8028194.1 hypothetical protein BT93_E0947 [Corymbia citriodora subsp. variegata]KAF8028195.1 hypothetical protein BT93_E0947 [Corymbia citriodora subsp. variegata]